jgi:hypothetical protein
MYSNVRYPRALLFTAENRMLSPSMKAVVRPRIQWARIPSKRPSTIRAARAIGSSSSPVCPRIACTQAHRVSEQLHGPLGILPLADALKHQPRLVRQSRYAPFQGHRIPLLRFFFPPVYPVLEPHPTRTLQPVPFPGVSPTLCLPDLLARLHPILDAV